MYPPIAPAPAMSDRIGLDPGKRLCDRAALDLAGRGTWDRGSDVNFLGPLEIGQALFTEREDRGFVDRLSQLLLQYDRGFDFLTPTRMRNTEADRFGDGRMAQQNFVDLTRADFFAA